MNMKKRYFSEMILLGVLFLLGSLLIIINVIFVQNNTQVYQIKSYKNSHYRVLLKPNFFYQEQQSKEIYPKNAVSSLNVDFQVKGESNKEVSISFVQKEQQELVATHTNKDGVSKEIWKKTILNKKENASVENKKKWRRSTTQEIDYSTYQQLVKQYEDIYSIKVDAFIKSSFTVTYQITIPGRKPLKFKEKQELLIPLTDEIMEVSKTSSPKVLKKVVIQKNKTNSTILSLITSSVFVLFISITLLLCQNNIQKNKVKKQLNKFLKDYKDLIVSVKNRPDFKDLELLYLDGFMDLIDVAYQNHLNIIYYKDTTQNKHFFYVSTKSFVYTYGVSENEK